jgi:hypothetical protein
MKKAGQYGLQPSIWVCRGNACIRYSRIQNMLGFGIVQSMECRLTTQPRKKRAPKHDAHTLPFSVGDVVVCDKYAGIADDGDEGAITAIRATNQGQEIEVSMPGGTDWFPLSIFHAHFLTTGR